MIKIVEMDERVTLSDQMEEKNVGSLILINKFNVNPAETEEFLEVWAGAAEIFKQQPGYILRSFTAGLPAAVSSWLMLYLSHLNFLRRHLTTLTFSPKYRSIVSAPWRPRIYLRK
jgi:hypothetical protein